MPELPEVETIARRLHNGSAESPSIVGRKILGAKLLWKRTLAEPSPRMFAKRIIGQSINKVDRRGKYLQLHLNVDHLLIHLRMSGDIIVGEGTEPLGSHPRLALFLSDDLQLSFTDARKFGRVWLVKDPTSVTSKLGPEPLAKNFLPNNFAEMLQSRKRQIKPLLLDQAFLAGVGNIYADESLHLAKIHPLTRSDQLSRQQAHNLYDAIRIVLQNGIDSNGSSIDWVYRGGDYQNRFRAFDRAGQPCIECQTPILKSVVGQRGTYHCPTCQVLSEVY